jgi:hypothetical protein
VRLVVVVPETADEFLQFRQGDVVGHDSESTPLWPR